MIIQKSIQRHLSFYPTNTFEEDLSINPYSVVSYFSGCGGLDLGFTGDFEYRGERMPKLPFKILSAYDNDEKCVETYNNYFEGHAKVKNLGEATPTEMPKADLLIGGFPCQDFSSCGPKAGLGSQRGQLYKSLVRYMEQHKPKIVVAENVPHLEKMGKGAILNTIVKDLEDVGYEFQVWRLYAPDYGIPQSRKRLFFIGVRNDIEGFPEKPNPTHFDGDYRSIDWAINDLETVTDESVPNQSQYFRASKAKRGNGQGDEINKSGQPSYTIRANAKSRVQFHHSLNRRLTVRECARLQTFPDDFQFPHSATTNIMQIGNAVPPLLAHRVAQSIAVFLKDLKQRI